MKIALVFAGQPRFVDGISYHSTKYFFLDKYICDVYAHFWFQKGATYETSPWSSLKSIELPDDTIDKFHKLYNPKEIRYEPPLLEKDIVKREYHHTSNPRTPYNNTSQMIALKKAFSLIQNPEDYDFIIKQRTDNIILRMPPLETLSKDHIHLMYQNEKKDTFSDAFLIFPGKYAKYYFNNIDILDTLYDSGCKFNSEELFFATLEYYNLLPLCKPFTFDEFNYAFLRENHIELCRMEEFSIKLFTFLT
jgi:hypothetical protein